MSEQNTSQNQKRVNVSLVVVFIIILVSGSVLYILRPSYLKFSKQPLQEEIISPQTQNNQHITTQNKNNDLQQVDQQQKIIYNNSQYGFNLFLPKTWERYITKDKILKWGLFGDYHSVSFGFPIQDSLFSISIHNKDQWQKIKSEEGPTPIYLGENNQYVFGYTTAHDAVNDEIIERSKEIKDIIKTFEIIK
jgi:hypothetical protein